MENRNPYITVQFQRATHKIFVSSILYIESDLRKIFIHTPRKIYQCYQKLSELETELNQIEKNKFIRCHRSYLIAIDKVDFFTGSHVYINQIILPISRKYQKEVAAELKRLGIMPGKPFVTPSECHSDEKKYGVLSCISGFYQGMTLRIYPEQSVRIGRNGHLADVVVNLPEVSRFHCSIIYHSDTGNFEICDQSCNGTFVNGKRLLFGESYEILPGSKINLGNANSVFILE